MKKTESLIALLFFLAAAGEARSQEKIRVEGSISYNRPHAYRKTTELFAKSASLRRLFTSRAAQSTYRFSSRAISISRS
jgi:hypothetical protein